MLRANLVILAQIRDNLLCGQAEFSQILSQNGQNDLEGNSWWPPFAILAEVSHGVCLVQIWWFQLKFVTSYRADKDSLRTDRQTDMLVASDLAF